MSINYQRKEGAPMALTKEDLLSISYLLDVKLDEKLAAKLRPVEEGISDIKSGIERLEVRVGRLEERMDRLEVRVDRLEAEVGALKVKVAELDEKVTELDTKVTELDTKVAELDEKVDTFGAQVRLTRLEMENIIVPQIQLLSENYVPAAKRYEKASGQIDEMQSDIDIMKHTITRHSEVLQRLA
jgi:chromosome segregation ATPase